MAAPRICTLDPALLGLVTLVLATPPPAAAVDYPGPPPGPARATDSGDVLTLANDAIAMRWSFANGRLAPEQLSNLHSSTVMSLGGGDCFQLLLGQTPRPGVRTLKASEMKLAAKPALRRLAPDPGGVRLEERSGGWEAAAVLISADPNLTVRWRAELRDGANFIRQEITLQPGPEPVELVEIALMEMRLPQAEVAGRVDGSPVVNGQFFLGVEHPASRSGVVPPEIARCSYPFHGAVSAQEPLTLGAVTGVFPPGQRRRGFLHYLERVRAHPFRPYLHHNNGEEIGETYWDLVAKKRTAEAAAYRARQARTWQALMETVGHELVARRGVRLECFAHDYAWDDETLVWQFHNGFPDGFSPLDATAAQFGADLGIWLSPWGGYPGKAARVKSGRQLGFETNQGGLSLAGPRYYARFRSACMNLSRDANVSYFKFDGFAGSNSPPGAGEYRGDVEALWRLLGELRQANPAVFLNPSSGTWASPFWLLRADSIWRGGGDTGLAGAKGSERQQWITYRDFEVHHRVLANGPLYPVSSLMIHGIMINSGGRVKTFAEQDMIDEIRSFFASGVNLQELYVSPELMTPACWDALAECAKWSRAHSAVLADTHWIGGDPAQGEVYGWAAWSPGKGILSLRNPSDQPASLALDLADAFELPPGAARVYALASPWKTGARRDPVRLTAGQPHPFQLAPFEVVTFDATPVR